MIFDKSEYKNLFYALKYFSNKFKEKKIVFPENHQNIKITFLFEMLKCLFPMVEITILNSSKITPKNQDEVNQILETNHDSKLSGHSGFNRTYSRIKENYYWPSMKPDIRT